MLNLRQYRDNPDRLSDLLSWAGLVAPGIVLNKDGSLQATIRFRGPDLESATEVELIATSARLNNILKRLGTGWAIFFEAKRHPANDYPTSEFAVQLAALIDDERAQQFRSREHFESSYFLTLVYLPPSDSSERLSSRFVQRSDKTEVDYGKVLESFEGDLERLVAMLRGILPEAKLLSTTETLTYLHSCISTKDHQVLAPEVPFYIDALLADSALLPGFQPKLGDSYLKIITILSFPGKSQPGILDSLNRLGVEYRWVSRFLCMDKQEALSELSGYKRRWFAKRKGIATLLKEVFTNTESIMTDSDAVNKAMDADEALQELSDDSVSYGYFTGTVVIANKDPLIANATAAEIERVINSLGFTTKTEDVNSVDAWLGTIPGNCRNNIRRPILNTLNLAHMIPLSAVWAGQERNSHLKGPALFLALTNGSTPFRLVSHIGDVGHTLIIGPTGAGKSVLLNFIEAQFLRYPDSQVYIFDKGGSARTLTAGVGGDHYDLGGEGTPLAFQPLARVDEPEERRWAHEWVLELIAQQNAAVTPSTKDALWRAIVSLASAKPEERTLFGLTLLLQDESLRQALLPFTIQGAHGHLLDSSKDTLSYSPWQCFEMEVLMETPSVVLPVLSYLFHRLEQRFTGRPTLLVLDEAWLFLDNKAFAAKIREWLKVLRKANVMVVFATQSITDISQSSIASTLREACFTKIYLPNSNALSAEASTIYERFGLNKRQIELVALAQPKRDYYYTSPIGNRLFELGLAPLALSYCTHTSKEQQALTTQLKAEALSTSDFNHRFVSHLGLTDYAIHFNDSDSVKEVA